MAEGEAAQPSPSPTEVHLHHKNEETNSDDSVSDLQNQITSLQNRVKELEAENAKLSSQLSACRCRKPSSIGLSPGNGLVSRGPSFTPEEDVALSHSWIEGSRDPLPGTVPKRDTLWESITDCYESRKPSHLPARTTKSLQCRWNAISTSVRKLQGCVRQVESPNPSSLSELDLMTKGKILFSPTENGKKGFIYDHVWPILKHIEKWDYNPYKQNHETTHSQSSQQETLTCPSLGTSSSGDMIIDDEDLLAGQVPTVSCNQPSGRDPEKAKRQKMIENSPSVTDMEEHSCEVAELIKNTEAKGKESMENDCDRKLKVMLLQAENDRRRLEYEKYDKEIKIMEKDVQSITNPVQRSFFAKLQEKIQERRKLTVGADKKILIQMGEAREDVSEAAVEHKNDRGAKEMKSRDRSSGYTWKTVHHAPTRYVALKIMYFGERFHGFASVQVEPTVESEIFKALDKTRLLVRDKEEVQYTRCGRTDKGVSSVGQVISLFLRSKSRDTQAGGDNGSMSFEDIHGEIDYVKVLNGVLPRDIRVISWCPVPKDFHSRFSCLGREYKYLFWREKLDILAMEVAGKKFVGEHDFRNFCKMDAANVHCYKRHITSIEISCCNFGSGDDQLLEIIIKGSGFLWHQIRCMVAVLFMIGEGLELPSVVDELLDTNRTPRKPQYVMAPELPLILQSCEFESLKFICSQDAVRLLHAHLTSEIRYYKLLAAIHQEALARCPSAINDQSPPNSVKKKTAHIPLMSRPTEPTYEERQAKQKAKKR